MANWGTTLYPKQQGFSIVKTLPFLEPLDVGKVAGQLVKKNWVDILNFNYFTLEINRFSIVFITLAIDCHSCCLSIINLGLLMMESHLSGRMCHFPLETWYLNVSERCFILGGWSVIPVCQSWCSQSPPSSPATSFKKKKTDVGHDSGSSTHKRQDETEHAITQPIYI